MDQPLSQEKLTSLQKQIWLRIAFALLVAMSLLYGINWISTPSVDRTSIRTANIEKGSIFASINAGGIIVPASEETLSSESNSQISKVFVQLGQKVEKGSIILQLETRGLDLAIENVKENLALKEIQISAKRLNSKKSINEIDSLYQLLEVELERHSVKASRIKQLSLTGAAAKQDLLESQLDVKRTKIELNQLKQSIQDIHSTVATEIEGLELEKSILGKSLIEQQRLLQGTTIRANRVGVVSWVKNQEGSSVILGEPLARISDHINFRVEASLSDFYAQQLKSGMRVNISYNKDNLGGELETLSPTIENGVMKLIIKLDQPSNPMLHPNIRVDVGLITESVDQVNTIMKGPFVNGSGLQNVYVIHDGIAVRTQVEIGLSNRDKYQIIGNINPGDEVIISDVASYLHLKEFKIN
ncbi:MAG: hypothetical protein COA74_15800 [Gammaproteobacteria bacterium]|nr:MAG: hypothetical protein COA74_15800 [Gammaproteobacteria bacterium]